MNPNNVALVRSSWAHVEAIAPTAAALFYQNLFDADPSLRPLFKDDMSRQGEKLMRMIGVAVGQLDELPSLVPVLQALAVRHVGYGVQEHHYQIVGTALLKTLSQGLADEFTPAVREAWSEAYATMADVMITASRRV